MRPWSLHPKRLDATGRVALWRETLLAPAVLRGRTKGSTRHPRLDRFSASAPPVARTARPCGTPTVASGRIRHDRTLLATRLARRDPRRLAAIADVREPTPHPKFRVVAARVEAWEHVASTTPTKRRVR